ncbi:hypothetical protein SADUNF_Sadunf05G0168200 [Salix dunnii]|uniref:Tim44-like domain-containing protein n=1 Tax=Salix dunnii TaxID=1413687 RepID=A0A835MZQ5_9ROSI|nr:hypothetical protein SADUNF_Sadunf05G0168200 [Salix dunnii]
MASRKLVRDLVLPRQPLFLHLTYKQVNRLHVVSNHGHSYSGHRRFSVFNEFSKKMKGEAQRNQEFRQSVKELKEKAEELKGVKEVLKVRTKQTTEQLYKHVDCVWTEAEATAKKVSANVKEKVSAATEEVKETFGIGKEEPSESAGTSSKDGVGAEEHGKTSPGEDKQSGTSDETLFGKFKSSIPSSNVSSAFQKLKEARVSEMMKKGYDAVKDELYGNTNTRKHLQYTPPPSFSGEISTKTDIVVLPSKQSRWSKKWEAIREKMQGHPLLKHFAGLSEPVVTKGHEIAEDMRERWETSDSPIVHKIQDVSDSIFQESDAAASIKEIRRRDPYDQMSFSFFVSEITVLYSNNSNLLTFLLFICVFTRSFSLMEFVAEVQEAIRPVLNAYMKGDVETLKKYCTPEVINRREAEHKAFEAHGIFFDNKVTISTLNTFCILQCSRLLMAWVLLHLADWGAILMSLILHVSDVEVRETKMMGTSPLIIVAFQTQQVHCIRDQNGAITEGGQDTIHTVYYAWAMRQVDPEELGGGAIYPIWKLMEMQQLGVQSLI